MTPAKALGHPHKAPSEVKKLFDEIEGRERRNELNLYVSGVRGRAGERVPGDRPRRRARPS